MDRRVHDCVGALLVRQDRILLGRRSDDCDWLAGAWDVFGGHVEAGESGEQAIARELAEELGIAPPWPVLSGCHRRRGAGAVAPAAVPGAGLERHAGPAGRARGAALVRAGGGAGATRGRPPGFPAFARLGGQGRRFVPLSARSACSGGMLRRSTAFSPSRGFDVMDVTR
ncbi:NUDIX domain-containing protein [Lysobacter sp. MMG2]|nr:NUDIX domain-containing protein [Lysobacter sp. MMG2]